MNVFDFFAPQNGEITEEIIISNRFTKEDGQIIPFIIRAVSEFDAEELRRRARRLENGKSVLDYDKYLLELCCKSMVSPDLQSAELQKHYGVLGEGALLSKMLLAGEYANLLAEVQKICGFDTTIAERKTAIKN